MEHQFNKAQVKRRIIGIGETVLDVIFRNDKPQDAIPGGSTFNALISLGRTIPKAFPEVSISMVTETGDDHIGDIIVSFMESNGVRSDAVTRNRGTQSHLSMAFLNSDNDAQYEFYKDHANAGLSEEVVSGISFSEDDIVLFGSFFAINPAIRNHTATLLRSAGEAGAILFYDINFRKSHIKDLPDTLDNISENCRMADFVRGSEEDFFYLFGTGDGRKIYDERISRLCGNLIVTHGAGPVEVFCQGKRLEYPVNQVETVSTIGAGDNFNAGFIYALVRHGILRRDCTALRREDWDRMIGMAGRFSSAVCRSIYNYVDSGFSAE